MHYGCALLLLCTADGRDGDADRDADRDDRPCRLTVTMTVLFGDDGDDGETMMVMGMMVIMMLVVTCTPRYRGRGERVWVI